MSWTVDQALEHWQQEKLLTKAKAKELKAALADDAALPGHAIRIFSAIGAILLGLGVMLFVASNWGDITPTFKVCLLVAALLASGISGYHLAYEKGAYTRTGFALLFVNALVFGASIFLVGQIYHLPLNFWWGMLLWFLGTAYMAYTLESKLHLWLSVPLLVFFLGWLRQSAVFGFSELDFLFDERANMLTLLPSIGLGLMSLSIFHRASKRTDFGEYILFHWGLFLILFPLVIATADKSAFFFLFRYVVDPVSVIIAGIAAVLALAAVSFGQFRVKQGRWAILGLLLYIAFTHLLAYVPEWMGLQPTAMYYEWVPTLSYLHILHILLVFILLLVIVWYGTLLRKATMINLGIAGLGIAIIIQYFSWAFALFDRSLAFILGGVIILGLSALLERQRRSLVLSLNRK